MRRVPVTMQLGVDSAHCILWDSDGHYVPDIIELDIKVRPNGEHHTVYGHYVQILRDEDGWPIKTRRGEKTRTVPFYIEQVEYDLPPIDD